MIVRRAVCDCPPIPLPAIILGSAGVVPLALGVIMAAVTPDVFGLPLIRIAIVYAAVILSFLGGMYWGMASSALVARPGASEPPGILGWSVVPALLGWIAAFLPPPVGASALAVMFIAVLLLDRRCVLLRYVPGWWMRLRIGLTAAMVVVLLLLAVVSV